MPINRKATIRWKGYDPDELPKNSDKRIWVNCKNCDDGRWIYRNQYRDLCKKCAAIFRELLPKPKFVSEENRFMPKTGIDRIKTIEEMGYDPIDLDINSGRKIWSVCQNCGDGKWSNMQSYCDLCHRCANRTDECCDAISKALTGVPRKPFTPEHCANLSKAAIGVPKSPEHCDAISIGLKESEGLKTAHKKQKGGNDIVNHHYIYDHSDLSKYTMKMTRSLHKSLHNIMKYYGIEVPHINVMVNKMTGE